MGAHHISGSSGSSTSVQSLHAASVTATIPFAVRIPPDDEECNTLWVNQYRQTRPREGVGPLATKQIKLGPGLTNFASRIGDVSLMISE